MLIKKHFIFSIKQVICKSLMPTSQKKQNIKFEAIHNSPKDEQENIAAHCVNQLSIKFCNLKPGGILERG
jgi:hypothetical protein